jgi:hypothetical protein
MVQPISGGRSDGAVPNGDAGWSGCLLGVAVSAIIIGLLMWTGWVFWRLDSTLARVAFVGLLGFVAFTAAYIARAVSR